MPLKRRKKKVSYLVVPDDMSEVSELSLFLSWTMLKSANLEKSVLAPWPMSRADLRDSRSRTSSNFFLTSGPPFWKRKQITFYNLENSANDSIIIKFPARFLKIEGKKTRQITSSSRVDFSWLWGQFSRKKFRFIYYL